MKQEIIELLLAFLCGNCLGLSVSLGIWPKWKQPKNIKIQILFAIVGLFFMWLLYMYFS